MSECTSYSVLYPSPISNDIYFLVPLMSRERPNNLSSPQWSWLRIAWATWQEPKSLNKGCSAICFGHHGLLGLFCSWRNCHHTLETTVHVDERASRSSCDGKWSLKGGARATRPWARRGWRDGSKESVLPVYYVGSPVGWYQRRWYSNKKGNCSYLLILAYSVHIVATRKTNSSIRKELETGVVSRVTLGQFWSIRDRACEYEEQ